MRKPSMQEEISGAVVAILIPISVMLMVAIPMSFVLIVTLFIRELCK